MGSMLPYIAYPRCSMYGIFSYKTGWFLGQMLGFIFQHHGSHMGIISISIMGSVMGYVFVHRFCPVNMSKKPPADVGPSRSAAGGFAPWLDSPHRSSSLWEIPRLCGCDNGMKRYGDFMVIYDEFMVIFMVIYNEFMVISWRLMVFFIVILWWLNGVCIMILWWFYGDFYRDSMVILWWLNGVCIMILWWYYGDLMVINDVFMVILWWLMMFLWWCYGVFFIFFMAFLWWLNDVFMVMLWCLFYGVFMVT